MARLCILPAGCIVTLPALARDGQPSVVILFPGNHGPLDVNMEKSAYLRYGSENQTEVSSPSNRVQAVAGTRNKPNLSFMPRAIASYLLLFTALFLVSCRSEKEQPVSEAGKAKSGPNPYHDIPGAEFVGSENCRSCHEPEYQDWLLSDHHLSMSPATGEYVLGDFNDTEFVHFGQKFRFFRKGEEFWVNAQDENGDYKDMKVDHTFGHYPLQQYLIPFPGGRYQALQVCWDSRPKEEGGQRWYHLYPDEAIPPDDLLHWTGRHFNWNYMCADCHSTNLDKNFDAGTLTYDTSWSEMNVSCEACHGPGSQHVAWAGVHEKVGAGASGSDYSELKDYMTSKGLVVSLREPGEGSWEINPGTGQPRRTRPLASNVQVETCSRCHAHRQLMEPVFAHGKSFHDSHNPSILNERLYHHDGQIREEVYVYGTFVQSKMFHAGVRCSDCHNPHSMKTTLPGNALCLQCHSGELNTPAHHFHPLESTGASCVECHMPTTNYMIVDPRRDHSIRIPRPDLARKLGSPDACTQCHADQTQDWAVEHFRKWWGAGPRKAHYGEILASARRGEPGSLDRLIALANDPGHPGIVRAAAIETAGSQLNSPAALQAVERGLQDEDPSVRLESLRAFLLVPAERRTGPVAPLLDDPRRSVRTAAVRALAGVRNQLTKDQRTSFGKASEEYIVKQSAIADRAAGHMELALFYTDLGQLDKAEAAYRKASEVEPEFIPARINFAEMLYRQNRRKEAEDQFRAAVAQAMIPENEGIARDALARFLIRLKRYDEGVEELRKATELTPEHAQIQYFYGVALNSLGRFDEALPYLEKAHDLDPYNVEYLIGLATICRDSVKLDLALQYARAALAIRPADQQLQELVRSLQ